MSTRSALVCQLALLLVVTWHWSAGADPSSDPLASTRDDYRTPPEQLARWSRAVEPFRIAGNLYYVGAHEVTAFLLTTAEGHILLDGGLPETAPMIASSIQKLGFELDDVKILLNSHAHADHAGGLAWLKRATGARLAAMAADVPVLESGESGFGAFPPVDVDIVLEHGDEVELGGTVMQAHLTPGHTAGCTTWSTRIAGAGEVLDVVFVGSPNALPEHDLIGDAEGAGLVPQFMQTFARLRALPVDVFLASHGSFFHLLDKIERLATEPAESVFTDPEGYGRFLDRKERQLHQELERQRVARRVASYFAPIVADRDFSGVVRVSRGDEILVARAFGEASFELDAPNELDTRFRVASLTKTFTAAAVSILAERGALSFGDPLSRFLPDFPNGERITVEHLLGHRAGLADADQQAAFRERVDLDALVSRIAAAPPLFEPGTATRYSNAGYNVLAKVVEVASGRSWQDFLQAEIFGPLGMTRTGHHTDLEIVPGRATGHLPGPPPAGVVNAPWSDIGFMIGSGSIVSTATDLTRWAQAVREQRLFRRQDLPWPYGWGRIGDEGLEQTGLATGFTASLHLWFDGLTVAILGNVQSSGWTRWPQDIAAIVRGEPVEPPPRRQVGSVEAPGRFVGRYANAEHTLEIVERDGSLWLHLDGWPVPAYLSPVAGAAGTFELRSDSGSLVFAERAVRWVYPSGGETSYPRIER